MNLLGKQKSIEDAETLLINDYPLVFVAMLYATGRYDELRDIYYYFEDFEELIEIKSEDMTLFIEKVLKPHLKMIEGKLHQGKIQVQV